MSPVIARVDQAVTLSLQRYASPPLDAGFTLIRNVGNLPVSVILALLIGVSLIRTGRARIALMLWALFAGGSIVELIGQHWLPSSMPSSLERPDLDTLNPITVRTPGLTILKRILQPPYAYPSGHAFRVLLLAAGAWIAWWSTRAEYDRVSRPAVLVTGVALMGVALVYLGDHRVSEVLGGYLLGVICFEVLSNVHRQSNRTGVEDTEKVRESDRSSLEKGR
jgi:membrane-associated phospholipid phosphatase